MNNHIHHHMQVLGDGGAVYTLGAQGNLPFGTACTRAADCCVATMDSHGVTNCTALPAELHWVPAYHGTTRPVFTTAF